MRDGVHTASMAGTWISLVYGFGGMRDYEGKLSFSPKIPDSWSRLKFKLTIGDVLLEVDIRKGMAVYKILEGSEISIIHNTEEINIKEDMEVIMPL